MEPLNRDLADRVYALDGELDEVVKRVQVLRERVPSVSLDLLNQQMKAMQPALR